MTNLPVPKRRALRRMTGALSEYNMKSEIIDLIIRFYLESSDFNGIPYSALKKRVSTAIDLNATLSILIDEDEVEIMFGDYHPNPHIKAFSGFDKKKQIDKIRNTDLLEHACVYPTRKVLSCVPDLAAKYGSKPYSMELALGAGQLDFRSFDLSVLEIYRNDPRYHYDNNDISGWISVTDAHSDGMRESDITFLETFGFSYSIDYDRAVAVFLRYLHDLTPEHQQIWKSKELKGEYKLHPDYYRNSILGDWGTRHSIFDAFILELEIINKMCATMGKPPLFKHTFSDDRPREFSFLLRPTLHEFNSFIHLLDKVMSDNINLDFFKGDVALESESERGDGKIIVTQKGTIQLLEQWVSKFFRPKDPLPMSDMFSIFKKVRKLRQKPAHSVNENEFDQKYFKEQRELVKEAYNAVRTIRLAFANHPAVKKNPPEIDTLLFQGKIWDI
jgi:hypothetical protein